MLLLAATQPLAATLHPAATLLWAAATAALDTEPLPEEILYPPATAPPITDHTETATAALTGTPAPPAGIRPLQAGLFLPVQAVIPAPFTGRVHLRLEKQPHLHALAIPYATLPAAAEGAATAVLAEAHQAAAVHPAATLQAEAAVPAEAILLAAAAVLAEAHIPAAAAVQADLPPEGNINKNILI